jgi:hypothetical protein
MLRLLISEPEVRKAAASKAREKVHEHYLWNRKAREIESIYLGMAAGTIPPKPITVARARIPRRAA